MRIYALEGEIPFRIFNFPDGQPHVELQAMPESNEVTIETAIRNPQELFELILAKDALQSVGKHAKLDIRYLMGARMDRRIANLHPNTLSVVASQILGAGFKQIRILDPHSSAALALLGATAVYPMRALRIVLDMYSDMQTWIMAPDAGSATRVREMVKASPQRFGILQGNKVRDMQTGKLSGFDIPYAPDLRDRRVLILDDICDGGGTFVGMAEMLRSKHGVKNVDLFVTHGIFSKGLPLTGIDRIWTTNSYREAYGIEGDTSSLRVIPVNMQME